MSIQAHESDLMAAVESSRVVMTLDEAVAYLIRHWLFLAYEEEDV